MYKKMLLLLIILGGFQCMSARQVIHLSPNVEDVIYELRGQLETVSPSTHLTIVLEQGTYRCNPTYALQKYCKITNHGNGLKNIFCFLQGYDSVEIAGNGATLLFHGQMFPFLFEQCKSVKVHDLTIDWDIPFTFLGEVIAVNPEEGWREIKPFTDGFSWKVEKGKILFPNVDGFSYDCLGSTLAFDKQERRVADGATDINSDPTKVEVLKNGNLKIYEKLRKYPPVGTLLSSKGDRQNDRYSPAFEFKECQNIDLCHITIHHALGMGYLFERSENIHIDDARIVLSPHTQRVISTTADATHFANCKGDILLENCLFQNMLDDGVNVHGTYVEVEQVINAHTVRVALKHYEQLGFKFTEAGDEVWLIQQPSSERQHVNKVQQVREINETYTELTFVNPLPAGFKAGDLVENKTWNPNFTLRESTIQNHRARNVVLKTPGKILIENNHFSSMMASILFRGESFFWFESGAVKDVLIRNNYFKHCVYAGPQQAVLYITPRLGKQFDTSITYDRNIRFVNNDIELYNNRVVWADRVDGLVVEGNTIHQSKEEVPEVFSNLPLFELVHCKNVQLTRNTFIGESRRSALKTDEASRVTLVVKRNRNFKF